MAKSARASTRKRNNAALRAKIFGPATDARTERLSAKLQELISKPKPIEEKTLEGDDTGAEAEGHGSTSDANHVENMDVDMPKTTLKPKHKHRLSKVGKKKAHRKAKNSIVFPSKTRKGRRPGMTRTKG